MTTPIEVREVPSQRLLVKKTTCGHKEIGPAFGKAIHSVGQCLRASEAKMGSMPMAVYLSWRDSDCDMAVGCKVEGNVTLAEGCEWLDVPGGSHAFASHFGPYDTLHQTHKAIWDWCAEKGAKMSGPCWEAYPTDPGLEPDSSKWQTDVYYPVQL
jgi:effector-binding domain-containing protein